MACLFAILGAFAPRLALILIWIFTPLVSRAFGNWIIPLLGVIFLPFTTLIYTLVVGSLGTLTVWGWLAVIAGLILNLRNYIDGYSFRRRAL